MKSRLWDTVLWEYWEEAFEAYFYFKFVVLTIFGVCLLWVVSKVIKVLFKHESINALHFLGGVPTVHSIRSTISSSNIQKLIMYCSRTEQELPDGTEACLADNPELLSLGRVPSITADPRTHINIRNRDQVLMDLLNLQKILYKLCLVVMQCTFSPLHGRRRHWVCNVVKMTFLGKKKSAVWMIRGWSPESSSWGQRLNKKHF